MYVFSLVTLIVNKKFRIQSRKGNQSIFENFMERIRIVNVINVDIQCDISRNSGQSHGISFSWFLTIFRTLEI